MSDELPDTILALEKGSQRVLLRFVLSWRWGLGLYVWAIGPGLSVRLGPALFVVILFRPISQWSRQRLVNVWNWLSREEE